MNVPSLPAETGSHTCPRDTQLLVVPDAQYVDLDAQAGIGDLIATRVADVAGHRRQQAFGRQLQLQLGRSGLERAELSQQQRAFEQGSHAVGACRQTFDAERACGVGSAEAPAAVLGLPQAAFVVGQGREVGVGALHLGAGSAAARHAFGGDHQLVDGAEEGGIGNPDFAAGQAIAGVIHHRA